MVYLLMRKVLYLLPPPYLFLDSIVHRILHSLVLHIKWEEVPLSVTMPRFLAISPPWSLLAIQPTNFPLWALLLCLYFLPARNLFCINKCMYHWLGSLLNILVWVFCPMILFPPRDPLSWGSPVYIVMCHVITALLVLLLFSSKCLAHGSYPYYWLGLHISQGCQYCLVSD